MKRREASLSGPKAVLLLLLVNWGLHRPLSLSLWVLSSRIPGYGFRETTCLPNCWWKKRCQCEERLSSLLLKLQQIQVFFLYHKLWDLGLKCYSWSGCPTGFCFLLQSFGVLLFHLIITVNEGLLNLSVVLSHMAIRGGVPSNLLYKPGLFQK